MTTRFEVAARWWANRIQQTPSRDAGPTVQPPELPADTPSWVTKAVDDLYRPTHRVSPEAAEDLYRNIVDFFDAQDWTKDYILSSDYGPRDLLEYLCDLADLTDDDRKAFPWKTAMIITPKSVLVREGYTQEEWVTLWSNM